MWRSVLELWSSQYTNHLRNIIIFIFYHIYFLLYLFFIYIYFIYYYIYLNIQQIRRGFFGFKTMFKQQTTDV